MKKSINREQIFVVLFFSAILILSAYLVCYAVLVPDYWEIPNWLKLSFTIVGIIGACFAPVQGYICFNEWADEENGETI